MFWFLRSMIPSTIKSAPIYQRIRSIFVKHDDIYTDEYYASDVEAAAVEAAPVITSFLTSHFRPRSVIDVGCGTGAMLSAIQEQGIKCLGLEYSTAGIKRCESRGVRVKRFDIETETYQTREQYNVAISFEVAEHIPESCAEKYVSLLCSLAPVVIISAAKPGQGGTDHVNLQPKSYWIDKFRKCGFSPDYELTSLIHSEWNGIANFYRDNTIVFRHGACSRNIPTGTDLIGL